MKTPLDAVLIRCLLQNLILFGHISILGENSKGANNYTHCPVDWAVNLVRTSLSLSFPATSDATMMLDLVSDPFIRDRHLSILTNRPVSLCLIEWAFHELSTINCWQVSTIVVIGKGAK